MLKKQKCPTIILTTHADGGAVVRASVALATITMLGVVHVRCLL
jgi:hypothetical protein